MEEVSIFKILYSKNGVQARILDHPVPHNNPKRGSLKGRLLQKGTESISVTFKFKYFTLPLKGSIDCIAFSVHNLSIFYL